jgi:hypothetical protein
MEQLNTYIQQARQQGQTDAQIRQALLNSGWSIAQVDGVIPDTLTPQAMPQSPPAQSSSWQHSDNSTPTNVTQLPQQQQPYTAPKFQDKSMRFGMIIMIVVLVVGSGLGGSLLDLRLNILRQLATHTKR